MTNAQKLPQEKTCANTWCNALFQVTQNDLNFYEKVSPLFKGKKELIPPPTLCPECRMQRRFTYRNEHALYKRTCDLSGRSMVSFYPAKSRCTVYDSEAWWSDAWDGISAGMDISWNRPFFPQLAELRQKTPRQGMMSTQSEGSFFSAYCIHTKNCYMCVSCVINEDSYYCFQTNKSKNCIDCSNVSTCELCYECIYCHGLYASVQCKDCENSSGLVFCEECRNCSDCIGCKNLINKKYCIFNEQLTAEDYAVHRKRLASYREYEDLARQFRTMALSLPTRASHLSQCENATGDHLRECRNVRNCFDATGLEDSSNISPSPQGTKDAFDTHYCQESELAYEGVSIVRSTSCSFSLFSWDCQNVLYTDECFNCHDLFGCIGLRQKKYCILNKQYSKEDYELLVPKIIEHMRKTGEWGEYFPVTDSPFAYNESIAMDDFPVSKEEVINRHWRWVESTEDSHPESMASSEALADSIIDTDDSILGTTIQCISTGRPYKLTKQEYEFYQQMVLPIPRVHPRKRYDNRISRRNPRRLWERKCSTCEKKIHTSYAPDRPDIIVCEECYLKEVY